MNHIMEGILGTTKMIVLPLYLGCVYANIGYHLYNSLAAAIESKSLHYDGVVDIRQQWKDYSKSHLEKIVNLKTLIPLNLMWEPDTKEPPRYNKTICFSYFSYKGATCQTFKNKKELDKYLASKYWVRRISDSGVTYQTFENQEEFEKYLASKSNQPS